MKSKNLLASLLMNDLPCYSLCERSAKLPAASIWWGELVELVATTSAFLHVTKEELGCERGWRSGTWDNAEWTTLRLIRSRNPLSYTWMIKSLFIFHQALSQLRSTAPPVVWRLCFTWDQSDWWVQGKHSPHTWAKASSTGGLCLGWRRSSRTWHALRGINQQPA